MPHCRDAPHEDGDGIADLRPDAVGCNLQVVRCCRRRRTPHQRSVAHHARRINRRHKQWVRGNYCYLAEVANIKSTDRCDSFARNREWTGTSLVGIRPRSCFTRVGI
jgi:hypothetical protein